MSASRGAFRIEIEQKLEFQGPLHVGTGERFDIATDAPLLRDAAGHVWLPGSSLRGVIRDWCRREASLLGVTPQGVDRLFGFARGERDLQGRLTVLDARLTSGKDEIRDHVRIQPEWGAAARGGKFDGEIAHATDATVTVIYQGDSWEDEELALLRSALDALRDGVVSLGAKGGWGFGSLRSSEEPTASVVDRSTDRGLSDYLQSRLPENAIPKETRSLPPVRYDNPRAPRNDEPRPWSWLRLRVTTQFDGPMLVAGPYRTGPHNVSHEAAADATYLVDPQGRPVLPGSALRGVLRSHARRIGATVGCPELTEVLFGKVTREESRRGLLRVGESRLHGRPSVVFSNHVAIDRVTGFAAHGKLFCTAALASPAFETEFLLRWHAGDQDQQAAVALFLFALRDFEKGLLWVGSRTTRGYGRVARAQLNEATMSTVVTEAETRRRMPPATIVSDKQTSVIDVEDKMHPVFDSWRGRTTR